MTNSINNDLICNRHKTKISNVTHKILKNMCSCRLASVSEVSVDLLLKMSSAYAALGAVKTFFKAKAQSIDISNATFAFAKYV